MEEKLYSVRIDRSGRYVKDCDDCWYESEAENIPRYTKERALEIARQMEKHYVYDVTISNGSETIVRSFKKDQAEKKNSPAITMTGKKNFKLKLK